MVKRRRRKSPNEPTDSRPEAIATPDEAPPLRTEAGDEMLRQVEQWDEDLRVHVEWHLDETARNPKHHVPLAILYLAEQTVEGLADATFREKYSALLAESGRAAAGRFMASDPEQGRKFIRELRVVEVIPASECPNQPDVFPGHSFPRPVVHHRSRADRKAPSTGPENIRLLLNHIPFLQWHPQYLLTCTRCGWPQGALATSEAYASDVAHPCAQVEAWWGRNRRELSDEATQRILERFVKGFSEEVWGGDVIKTPADRQTPLIRRPVSGDLGRVLDEAFSFRSVPEWWPHKEKLLASRAERIDLLGQLLVALKCQICAETGHLRYMPRILFPIDADLSAQTQAEVSISLASLFEDAREALAADPFLCRVLWLPQPFPRLRLSELAQRFELRHQERARRSSVREQNWWLVAMWLADVSSASRKRVARRKDPNDDKRRRRKTKPKWTWRRIFEELGAPISVADLPEEDESRRLPRLQSEVDRICGRKDVMHAVISKIREMLTSEDYGEAPSMLEELFTEKVLGQKLGDLHRNR